MNIAADLSWKTIKKSLLRQQANQYKERPDMLNPTDKTRIKEEKDE